MRNTWLPIILFSLLGLTIGCDGSEDLGRPFTCASGCVDENGVCQTGHTKEACGTGGSPCQQCKPGEACGGGACQPACNHLSCPDGCCQGNVCVSPPSNASCGVSGAACVACGANQTCVQGFCADESAGCTSCTGCCSNNTCLPGNTKSACGANGDPCAACSAGQACKAGTCEAITHPCDATSCPGGCCTANNVCLPAAQQDATACGVGGAACVVCAGGSACQQGSCVTDQPCFSYCKSGCCTSQGQCLDFTSQDAQSCGTGGSLCQACASSESCLGGQCQSDPVWEIWVVSAVLSGKKSDGKDWDSWPQKPLPDPYVYLTANPSYPCDFINADCGYTQKISNTVTPYWNKNVLARSHAFITSKPWHVEVLDSDGVLGVEAVGKCTIQITSGMLSFGAHTQSCGQLVSSLELKFVKQ